MGKQIRYLWILALLLIGANPVGAELCQPGVSCCVAKAQFDYACFVSCEDPPGVDQKQPDFTHAPTFVVSELLFPNPQFRREPGVVPPGAPESVKAQLGLLLAQTRPNPPPFVA